MKRWMAIAVCITALPISSAFAAWQEIGSNEQSTVSLDIETLKKMATRPKSCRCWTLLSLV